MQNFLYVLVSTVLVLLPCVIILCMTLQFHIDRTKGSQDTLSRVLVYCVYIFSLACSLNGYSLHWSQLTSRVFDNWCTGLGFPFCFAFLGSIKAFLTAFFFRRAQMASGIMTRRKRLFFARFAPVYVSIYWVTYCITAGASFRGRRVPNDLKYLSTCEFDGVFWIFIFVAGLFDVFNCVSTLYLFIHPLIKVMKPPTLSLVPANSATKSNSSGVNQPERVTSHSEVTVETTVEATATATTTTPPIQPVPSTAIAALELELARKMSGLGDTDTIRDGSNHTNRINEQFISVLKWNIVLSAIATISSIATLFLFASSYGYLTWFLCLGDPLINTLCTFFMLGKNRAWLASLFKK